MKTHQYLETSWQSITDQIKEHFGWDVLTQETAREIMRMYLKQTPLAEMIKRLED